VPRDKLMEEAESIAKRIAATMYAISMKTATTIFRPSS